MTNRQLAPRRHIAAILTALALGATGLATAAPAHADILCPGQVEVASTAGDFCVTPLPDPGVSVSASGTTTVTNNMLAPVTVKSDTGATATVNPGLGIVDINLSRNIVSKFGG
ncbi:hypothetical protein GCM10010211_26370 [Streptomyces albospinus]|uniref:Chaplin domain-containing protein n=1 Tax=Streptomyces albospinus TaxID=285515 RepID=A0ABQ2UYU5_9ACTN|nr:hypothetical protein [Streptomyces albospinus]GGU60073.1 hypothetical protein GCM10010211_26370 [Streptomyces albospinus]